jgi:hypothetical protein
MAVTCDRCEAKVPYDASFCTRCGLKIPTLRCYSCGEAIYPREDNCSSCGKLQPHAVRQPPVLPPHTFTPPQPPVAPLPPPPLPQQSRPAPPPRPKKRSGCGCLALILLGLFAWLVSRDGQSWLRQRDVLNSKSATTPPAVDWDTRRPPAFSPTPPSTVLGARQAHIANVFVNREPERVTITVQVDSSSAGQFLVAAYVRDVNGRIVPSLSRNYLGVDGGLTASKAVNAGDGRRRASMEIPYSALREEDRARAHVLYVILYGADGREWSRVREEFPPQIQYRYR